MSSSSKPGSFRRFTRRLFNALRQQAHGVRGAVSPEVPNDLYQASRSISLFAGRFGGGGPALDLRCGTGFGLAALRETGCEEVAGLEERPALAGYARKKFGTQGISVRSESPEAAVFEHGRFRLVVAAGVLAQAEAHEPILDKVVSWLRPDGTLVATVPPIGHPAALESARGRPELRRRLYVWYWEAILGEWFGSVRAFRHLAPEGPEPDFSSPFPSRLSAERFRFEPVEMEAFRAYGGLSAVFACSEPRLPRWRSGLSNP